MISTRAGEASSSPSSSSGFRYDVFLSFRGDDTRKTFTGHLHTALCQAGFRTFLDDDELEYGDDIKMELEKAIRESKISLVLLSENYASSRWCLDELVKIFERKDAGEHSVVPIFYNVKPTDVRHLSGNFGEAFKRRGRKSSERKEDLRKLQDWEFALQRVANCRGLELEKVANGIESKFVQQIVRNVTEKVRHKKLDIKSYLVGINDRARDIDNWLQDEANDVHIRIICGMGGIEKTTIVKFLYNNNHSKFEASSFLENVRKTLKESRGLHCLQEQLFSDILKDREKKVHNNSEAIFELQNSLKCKKVLIIFDAVDEQEQLDKILGERNWLLGGSKIIITTRNGSLLSQPRDAHVVTRIEALSPNESLKLFSWHAFRQPHPSTSFKDVSETAMKYCEGLPLAIEVLASSLGHHGDDLGKWENDLRKLEEMPNEGIFRVLRASYDSLRPQEKNLFLHIACLFVGKYMDKLNWIGFQAMDGIVILMNMCLLEAHSPFQMHQLLQKMGRKIVREESWNELGQCRILWNHNDSFNVLREKTGTGNVKSIVLDGSQLRHSYASTMGRTNEKRLFQRSVLEWLSKPGNSHLEYTTSMGNLNIVLETDAFAKMHNLEFLRLKCVQLHGDYENFPKRLKCLKWHGSPLQSIPINFAMESLVVLNMKYSSLRYLWDGSKNLSSLEILNLKDSYSLRGTADFSMVPKLKQLILENCTSLVELHESIGNLKNLIMLDLKNCKILSKLPGSIGELTSLDTLDVSGCSRLEGLPLELKNLDKLQVLCANGIGEETTWQWKTYMCKWTLESQKIPKITLACLPQSLNDLSLQGCNLSDEDFPSNPSILLSLEYLNLNNNMISKPPDFIKSLQKLKSLSLESCAKLQYAFVPNLEALYVNNCPTLERITSACENPDTLVEHKGCGNLTEVEGAFKLEPMENFDMEILKNLGLYNLEAPPCITVKFRKRWEKETRKFPLQVYSAVGIFNNLTNCFQTEKCFEVDSGCTSIFRGSKLCDRKVICNIFSTWVPRSKVSCWSNRHLKVESTFALFSQENTTTTRSLSVLIDYGKSGYKSRRKQLTQGLIVRIEYERRKLDLNTNHLEHLTSRNHLLVRNKSKKLRWEVFYEVMGIPETNEDMTWLTFVKMSSHHAELGDELSVSAYISSEFNVKEIGMRLLYKEHEQGPTLSTTEQSYTLVMYIPNNVDANLTSDQNGPEYDGRENLAEVEDAFKLEKIENVDTKILYNLGLSSWETLKSINVKLCKRYEKEAMQGPLKVYSKFGIPNDLIKLFQTSMVGATIFKKIKLCSQEEAWNVFSIWVPKSKVSCWFNYHRNVESTFIMPSDKSATTIQGLTVHIVYQSFIIDYFEDATPCCDLMVHNHSKGLYWDVVYEVMGIPETNEEIVWSTFFQIASHHVEGGDELSVAVTCCDGFTIKEINVQLVYKKDEQRRIPSTIAQSHALVMDIPRNVDAYLRNGQNEQDKLKLCARGCYEKGAFGGFITSESGMWVIGYYGKLVEPNIYFMNDELEAIYNGLRLVRDQICIKVEIETSSRDVLRLIEKKSSLPKLNPIARKILEKYKHLYTVKEISSAETQVKSATRLAEMDIHVDQGVPFVILEKQPARLAKMDFPVEIKFSL